MLPSPVQPPWMSEYEMEIVEPSLFQISFPPFHRMQLAISTVLGTLVYERQPRALPLVAELPVMVQLVSVGEE